MAIPVKYPQWAVDDVINPLSGQPNVVDPDTVDPTKKLVGWDFKEYPPRQYFNYLQRLINDWIEYFNNDVLGNTMLGTDTRSIEVSQVGSFPSGGYSDLNIIGYNDLDITSLRHMDIFIPGDSTIDSDTLSLITNTVMDIFSGDSIGMESTTTLDITAGTDLTVAATGELNLNAAGYKLNLKPLKIDGEFDITDLGKLTGITNLYSGALRCSYKREGDWLTVSFFAETVDINWPAGSAIIEIDYSGSVLESIVLDVVGGSGTGYNNIWPTVMSIQVFDPGSGLVGLSAREIKPAAMVYGKDTGTLRYTRIKGYYSPPPAQNKVLVIGPMSFQLTNQGG